MLGFIVLLYLMIPTPAPCKPLIERLVPKSPEPVKVYPEHVRNCWNPNALPNIENFFIVATFIKNKRSYVREWLEFHIMMGINKFIFYDNMSEDGLFDLLHPYIQTGQVDYYEWPPKNEVKLETEDKLLEEHFKNYLKGCLDGKLWECQVAAFDDGLIKARGKARWFAAIDVDEYFYIPEDLYIGDYQNQPLVKVFKEMESYNIVKIVGQHFGTSGWYSAPRRGDDQITSQLMIKTHLHHKRYTTYPLFQVNDHVKPIVNPFCFFGAAVHGYFSDGNWINNISIKILDFNDGIIHMNHYGWPSLLEVEEKVILNKNPSTAYNYESDVLLNTQKGSPIDYLIPKLELNLQEAYLNKKSIDGHADDWDFTLRSKHIISNDKNNTDICAVLYQPRHIGLARHALSNIVEYFHRIESNISYSLHIYDPDAKIKAELQHDFPVDHFMDKDVNIGEFCPADLILNFTESSFARWAQWPKDVLVFEIAMKIFDHDLEVTRIFLGDSSNYMQSGFTWTQNELGTTYRENPNLSNALGAHIIRKNNDNASSSEGRERVYEMCLFDQDFCINNRVKGLFEDYEQERMYNYPSFFTKKKSFIKK